MRPQQLCAAIYLACECRLGRIQPAPHIHVMVAEAREKEGDRTLAAFEPARGTLSTPQGSNGIGHVAADHGPAMDESLATVLQSERHVCQIEPACFQPIRQPSG